MTQGLVVDDVTVRFGEQVAVDAVDLDLAVGQVLSVLGPSGCGKSTLLRVIAGLQTVQSGTVRFAGADVTAVPTHKRGFGLMFQDGQLFDHLDVAGNIAYPLRRQGVSRGDRAARVAELLDLVGLGDYEKRRVSTLSGGQQQRVALARALAPRPRLLLLDEPLSALDRDLRERLAADLRTILVATGTTALLVTHDHDEALTVADRLALMVAGRIVTTGPADEVWHAPVDRTTARLLGYRDEVDAASWSATGLPQLVGEGPIMLRDNAFRVDAGGPLSALVRESAVRSSGAALRVDIEGVGVVSAVADDPAGLAVGQRVRLVFNPHASARLPVDQRTTADLGA
jgi:thiamine transport system ATP-binding protein